MSNALSSPSRPATLTLLAGLALALCGCATATGSRSQQFAERAQQRFAQADLDRDGQLSRDEAEQGTPRLAGHFDEIDSDHDGLLSTAEILSYLKQRRGGR
jgi:Ca2+-binding EF-hand superfamily protein